MQSSGGLREHEDIIVEILRGCHCRKSPKEVRTDSTKVTDARALLYCQGALIDRLKTIEVQFKSPLGTKE